MVFLGGISDANTLVGGHFAMEAVVDDIEFFAADIFAVQFSRNAQALRQLTGAVCIAACPDQHRFRLFFLTGDDVQQPMNAVAQIDIDCAGFHIHDFRPLGLALVGMAGGISFAAIGFRFGNAQPLVTADQHFANKIPGNFQTGAMLEIVT